MVPERHGDLSSYLASYLSSFHHGRQIGFGDDRLALYLRPADMEGLGMTERYQILTWTKGLRAGLLERWLSCSLYIVVSLPMGSHAHIAISICWASF